MPEAFERYVSTEEDRIWKQSDAGHARVRAQRAEARAGSL